MLQSQNNGGSASNCLIAVGANLPSPAGSVSQTVVVALGLLAASESVELRKQSRLFQTPAYPVGSGPDFVNAAVEIATDLPPDKLMALLHRIELQMGRTRTNRWEARVLDLDLLACGDLVLPDNAGFDHWMNMPEAQHSDTAPPQLILPHPRLHNRGFVLAPLADIAPAWMHPRRGQTVRQMLDQLPADDLAGIIPLAAQEGVPPDVHGK
jgi:2-amino-4-hydroxy-6-hydroxymethyldihydropteridine diphosphokinase